MPKEEKQLDVKTGRVRRKAVFGDTEDESGDEDSEDDEEMSEGDRTGSGSSDEDEEEEEEEEEGAKATSCKYLSGRGSKRPKLEEQEEDSEADLPAFADSDDDLERSSGEEEAAEEADESSEDSGDSAAGERDIRDSKSRGGGSGPRSSAAHEWRDRPDVERPSPTRKAALTTSDSGHCTAEEAFPSEDESGDSELSSDEDSEHKGGVVRGKPASPQGRSGQKLESENMVDETSDIETLLKEEEEHKEENSSSMETSGKYSRNARHPHTVGINRMFTFSSLLFGFVDYLNTS